MINIAQIAPHLTQASDGVWVSDVVRDVSYPVDGNAECFEIEANSYWFRHRNRVITALVRKFPPAGPIFDIGGGNGFVAAELQSSGFDTVVVEPGRQGAALARQRNVREVICGTLDDILIDGNQLPACGLFDVLEHIEQDEDFLRQLQHGMITGGRLYLTVPAYRWLWSIDDVAAGHFRRYTCRKLKADLQHAGFEVEYCSYFFRALPLPIFLLRSLPSWIGLRRSPSMSSAQRDHSRPAGMMGRWLESQLNAELRVLEQGGGSPWGSSCVAVARKA